MRIIRLTGLVLLFWMITISNTSLATEKASEESFTSLNETEFYDGFT